MNWYYVEAGKQMGPVDDAGLDALAATGKITNETLVWNESMANWQAYSTVKPGGLRIAGAPASTGGGEAVCAECGQMFPVSDTIQIGGSRVCANCKPVFVQKMREGVDVAAAGTLHYAGFWIRFAAVFVDGLLLQAVNVVFRLVFGLGFVGAMNTSNSTAASAEVGVAALIVFALQMLVAIGYETIMIWKYGATLGKMACKIHVVTPDGGPISFGTSLGRYFSKIVSSLICAIGYIMAAFDDEKRALHDRMCSTRVVYK